MHHQNSIAVCEKMPKFLCFIIIHQVAWWYDGKGVLTEGLYETRGVTVHRYK